MEIFFKFYLVSKSHSSIDYKNKHVQNFHLKGIRRFKYSLFRWSNLDKLNSYLDLEILVEARIKKSINYKWGGYFDIYLRMKTFKLNLAFAINARMWFGGDLYTIVDKQQVDPTLSNN